MTKVESCQVTVSAIGQLYAETNLDTKSRFSPSLPGAEVICPQPRRVIRVPCVFDSLDNSSPKTKSSYHPHKVNHALDFWDFIFSKDEFEVDPNNHGFFCGSPPVRTNNPLINDAEFAKLNHLPASPLSNCHVIKPAVHDSGSPSHGTSPKIRVEGFACGSPDSPRVVSALA